LQNIQYTCGIGELLLPFVIAPFLHQIIYKGDVMDEGEMEWMEGSRRLHYQNLFVHGVKITQKLFGAIIEPESKSSYIP
jgi:hypothetical protein